MSVKAGDSKAKSLNAKGAKVRKGFLFNIRSTGARRKSALIGDDVNAFA